MVEEDFICAITSEGNGCIDIMKAMSRSFNVSMDRSTDQIPHTIHVGEIILLCGKEQNEQEPSSKIM